MNTQSAEDQFYHDFGQCYSLFDQIYVVRTTPYDLYSEEHQPLDICEEFLICNKEEAMEAAKAMMYRFGNIIIDRHTSHREGRIETLVESLEYLANEYWSVECDNDGCVNSNRPNRLEDGPHMVDVNEEWILCEDVYTKATQCDLMREAFLSLGMKPASEYPEYILSYIYESGTYYREGALIDYFDMRPFDLKKDLIEYLHQPRFVAKWIENGDNDILDYLE